MSTAPTQVRYTPEDLLSMPDSDSYELIDGQLVERHMGMTAGLVEGRVIQLLNNQNDPITDESLKGWILSAAVGYQCFADPGKIRKPDVSYIKRLRLPVVSEGWIRIIPDAAIEVVSPNDDAADLEMKLQDYFEAKVPLVWVLYPESRAVWVYRGEKSIQRLREHDELTGEDVIPNFRCKVADLFATLPRT